MSAFRTSIPDFQLANPIYIGATVALYTIDENGEQTETLADLFAAPTGTTKVVNPQTLDSEGKFKAPVYIETPVIAVVEGPNVASHHTGTIGTRGIYRGEWAANTIYYNGDTVADPTAPYAIYVAAQDFRSGESLADDVEAGNFELRIKGGDTLYVSLDDGGQPGSGERFRQIISESARLYADAPNAYARPMVAATAVASYRLLKRTSLGVETQIGTVTFNPGSAQGVIEVDDTVDFAAGEEFVFEAPNPRDDTLSGVAMTFKLIRLPT
jgi:hypothetical protein